MSVAIWSCADINLPKMARRFRPVGELISSLFMPVRRFGAIVQTLVDAVIDAKLIPYLRLHSCTACPLFGSPLRINANRGSSITRVAHHCFIRSCRNCLAALAILHL